MPDVDKSGLYGKFKVTRTDGQSEPGEKHYGCKYFVLDLTHDPHAKMAIAAYIDSCEEEYPILAKDLTEWLVSTRNKDDIVRWAILVNP